MKLSSRARFWIVASVLTVGGCDEQTEGSYTLFRSSPGDPSAEVHVATFDTSEGDDYNRENCQTAAGLFAGQPGVVVRYWCEPGRFFSRGF